MFSSFSSFLPSVLQPNQEQRYCSDSPHQEAVDPSPKVPRPSDNDPKSRKKDRREKLVNEVHPLIAPRPIQRANSLSLRPSSLYDLLPVNRTTRSISRFNWCPHNLDMIDLMPRSRLSTRRPQTQQTPRPAPLICEEQLRANRSLLRSQVTTP